jgi:hypothetical protein
MLVGGGLNGIRRYLRVRFAGILPSGHPARAAVAGSYANRVVVRVGMGVMGSPQDHRKYAEECVAMARLSQADGDRALWLTLAQSWVRLAEHAAHVDAAQVDMEFSVPAESEALS